MTRLKEQYDSQIKAAMMKKFGYKNEMQIPKLVNIDVNMGVDAVKVFHNFFVNAKRLSSRGREPFLSNNLIYSTQ